MFDYFMIDGVDKKNKNMFLEHVYKLIMYELLKLCQPLV